MGPLALPGAVPRPWRALLVCLVIFTSACGAAQTGQPNLPEQGVECDPNLEAESGTTYYYVAPTGHDGASGSCREPVATLQQVEKKIRAAEGVELEKGWPTKTIENSYTVYVRGGTYSRQEVRWHVASADPNKWVRILAYPGERPVFDGEGLAGTAFEFEVGRSVRTNFQLSGFTWRHYRNGVKVLGRGDKGTRSWTGGAVISHNVLEEIGDVYDKGACERFMKESKTKRCYSHAVIGLGVARDNVVEKNILVRGEGRDSKDTFGGGSRATMHALYISQFSTGNIIRDNYISLISGDPIDLRWGSSNNQIYRNVITDSGQRSFVLCWFTGRDGASAPCVGNVFRDNVLTFGYPWVDSQASRCSHPVLQARAGVGSRSLDTRGLIVNQGNVVYSGERPRKETIAAMASADLDGDGKDEVVLALNYGSKWTKIVATDGHSPYLSRVLFFAPISTVGRVNALAAGRFDESGKDQLVVALQKLRPEPSAEIWRGNGASLIDRTNGAQNLGNFFRDRGVVVDALVAGNFDGSDADELLAAIHRKNKGGASIFRGDGKSSIGQRIFGPSNDGNVRAMAAGDLDGDGEDTLFTAFFDKRGANGSGVLKVYQGDGVDSVDDELLLETPSSSEAALAVSSNAATRRLYAAFDRGSQNESSEVRYASGENPSAFDHLDGSAPRGSGFTHLVLPNSSDGKAVKAVAGPTGNVVSDGEVQYYRWDKPTGKLRCSGR